MGKQVSTRASKVLTNSSTFSALQLALKSNDRYCDKGGVANDLKMENKNLKAGSP
jgi:hypothetical protein